MQVAIKVFAINIQKYRLETGLNFEELEDKCQIKKEHLMKIEEAKLKNISIQKLYDISKALNIELYKMFFI